MFSTAAIIGLRAVSFVSSSVRVGSRGMYVRMPYAVAKTPAYKMLVLGQRAKGIYEGLRDFRTNHELPQRSRYARK